MAEKQKKDLLWIILILILLAIILVISGLFYLNFITGSFGTTGHVILTTNQSETLHEKTEESILLPNQQTNLQQNLRTKNTPS